MRKLPLLVTLTAVFFVAGAIGISHRSLSPSLHAAAKMSDSVENRSLKINSLKTQPPVLKASLPAQPKAHALQPNAEKRDDCLARADSSLAMSADEFETAVLSGREPIATHCGPADSQIFAQIKSAIETRCQEPGTSDDADPDGCRELIATYRSLMAEAALRAGGDLKRASKDALLAAARGALISGDLTTDEGKESFLHFRDQITDEIFAREPDSILAHRLKVESREYIEKPEELGVAVSAAMEAHPEDDDLRGAYFAYRMTQQTAGEYLDEMRSYVREHDSDPVALYWLASAYWFSNDREHAVGAMKRSLELNPNFEAAHDSLQKARDTHDTSQAIFTVRIEAD